MLLLLLPLCVRQTGSVTFWKEEKFVVRTTLVSFNMKYVVIFAIVAGKLALLIGGCRTK